MEYYRPKQKQNENTKSRAVFGIQKDNNSVRGLMSNCEKYMQRLELDGWLMAGIRYNT